MGFAPLPFFVRCDYLVHIYCFYSLGLTVSFFSSPFCELFVSPLLFEIDRDKSWRTQETIDIYVAAIRHELT